MVPPLAGIAQGTVIRGEIPLVPLLDPRLRGLPLVTCTGQLIARVIGKLD